MPLRIAHLPSSDKLSHVFSFPVLQEIYPADLIGELLSQQQTWEQRERKLSQFVMVYLLIAWPLFLNQSLRSILLRLTSSLRLLGQLSLHILPSRAALSYRRKQLGVRLLRTLMRRVCRPRASHQTPGAFAFGLRLMGIDGTLEDLADTEENAAFFGRTSSGDTRSPYPQMRCVHLVEIGTHAIVDTMAAPCHADEHRLGWGLLRSLGQDMLLLFDRGFVAAAFLEAVLARGTQVLARLAQGIFLHREQVLPDSSYLTTLDPRHCVGLQAPLQVRISEYRLRPPISKLLQEVTPSRLYKGSTQHNHEVGKLHRLITTLLDHEQASALDLVLLYHERWEVELVIDETKNHLRLSQTPLRSRLPLLSLQEFYAIVLAHYALQSLMLHAAHTQPGLDPDRISFTLAVQELGDALRLSPLMGHEQVPTMLAQISASLLHPDALVAPRRLRFNSRVTKQTQTRFRRKRPHHRMLSFPHLTFADILLL